MIKENYYIEIKCDYCEKLFKILKSYYYKRKNKNQKTFCCSEFCSSKIRMKERKGKKIKPTFLGKHHKESTKEKVRGKNHYRYNGGSKIWRRKQNNKRKGLGFIQINEYFDNSESHHLNKNFVLFIPKELHQSIRHNVWNGYNMEEINDLAIKWYFNYE